MIAVNNTVDFSLEHVNAFCIATGRTLSAALALSGYLIGANIRDCALVAGRGIVARGEETYLLTANLRVSNNFLLCEQRGISLEAMSFHYGDLRLSDNLLLGCNDVGIALTGGALPGSSVRVEDNTLNLAGKGVGIRSGLDGLRVSGNEISHSETSTGDGIVIDGGLDRGHVDNLQIVGNRIQGLGGHGIAIRRPVGHGMIKSNVVKNVAGSGLMIEQDGSADYLAIESNHFLELGHSASEQGVHAGALLFRVKRVDFIGNVMNGIALTTNSIQLRAGILAFACEEVRVTGNRLHNIGPREFVGETTGIRCLPPFDHVAIDDNTVVGTENGHSGMAWCALKIGTSSLQRVPVVLSVLVPLNNDKWLLVNRLGIARFSNRPGVRVYTATGSRPTTLGFL